MSRFARARRARTALCAAALAACGGAPGNLPNGSVVNSPGGGATSADEARAGRGHRDDSARQREGAAARLYFAEHAIAHRSISPRSTAAAFPGVNATTDQHDAQSARLQASTTQHSSAPATRWFARATTCSLSPPTTDPTPPATCSPSARASIDRRQRRRTWRFRTNVAAHARRGHRVAETRGLAEHGKRGKPLTIASRCAAYDATGAQIVGPSHYALPITLDDSRRRARTRSRCTPDRQSGESLRSPADVASISLSYDGNAQASSVYAASERRRSEHDQRSGELRPARQSAAAAGRDDLRAQPRRERRTRRDRHRVRRQSQGQRRARSHAAARLEALRAQHRRRFERQPLCRLLR